MESLRVICPTLLRRKEQGIAPWKKSPRREPGKKMLDSMDYSYGGAKESTEPHFRSNRSPPERQPAPWDVVDERDERK